MNQQQQQQKPQGKSFDLTDLGHWADLMIQSAAFSVEVFLHKPSTFGERYVGKQAVFAVAMLVCIPLFSDGTGFLGMMALLVGFLLLCARVQGQTRRRRRLGLTQPHSYYNGEPWIPVLPGLSEITIKKVGEPLLVVVVGCLLIPLDQESLTIYLWGAAMALHVIASQSIESDRNKTLDLNDVVIDQRRIVEQWRDIRRD